MDKGTLKMTNQNQRAESIGYTFASFRVADSFDETVG